MTAPANRDEVVELLDGLLRNGFSGGAPWEIDGNALLTALEQADVVLMPAESTEEMLQGACEKHIPGQPMKVDDPFANRECPRFITRRTIYSKMLASSPYAKPQQ